MAALKKFRPRFTPLKIGIAIIVIIILWLVLQVAIQAMMDSLYFRMLILCFLGFGFLTISWILKYW
ncbi:MAG: hypothetical protein GYA23_06695 [Methanomicrobiales archaeon]|nr:hypothetical protein [Methanomicrobiales archaeon]